MAMTRNELMEAFREATSCEFENIPAEKDIPYEFSSGFEKRMAKLIKKEKSAWWHFTNTPLKRLAVVAAAIVLLFTTGACIPAIRNTVTDFVIHIYETHAHYGFKGNTTDTITTEYRLDPIPEGFVETDVFKSGEALIERTYEDENGNQIILTQSKTNGTGITIDRENGYATALTIDDISIEIYTVKNYSQAVWVFDNYVFILSYYGQIDIKDLSELVKCVH